MVNTVAESMKSVLSVSDRVNPNIPAKIPHGQVRSQEKKHIDGMIPTGNLT